MDPDDDGLKLDDTQTEVTLNTDPSAADPASPRAWVAEHGTVPIRP